MSTWWIGQAQLDGDQRNIITLPIDDNTLVTGPPGCGKTNILLLRANHLYLLKKTNIAVVTFTRALREFISSGASRYDFPPSKIVTSIEWSRDILKQYGVSIFPTGSFEEIRIAYINEVGNIIKKYNLSNIYDAVLLDEAQDYLPEEIRIFAQLATRLFCVADERQKIYDGEDSIETIKSLVIRCEELRFHYRNGLKICKVADHIATKWPGHHPLEETSNYDDISNPSSVELIKLDTLQEQVTATLSRLESQLSAFPNDLIGIVAPKQESVAVIWQLIEQSEFASRAALLSNSQADATLSPEKRIVVGTCHATKGFEFRSMHLLAAELLSKFKNNRKMTFTAVTRTKTSLTIYHSGPVHGYLESAIASLEDEPEPPTLDDIFGGSQ